MPGQNKRSQPSCWYAQAGLLTAIPIVLLVGPAIGYVLGTTLDRRFNISPWGLAAGIALGMAASARVIMQMLQQAKRFQRDD